MVCTLDEVLVKFTLEYLPLDLAANKLCCTRTDLLYLAAEGGIDCYARPPQLKRVVHYRKRDPYGYGVESLNALMISSMVRISTFNVIEYLGDTLNTRLGIVHCCHDMYDSYEWDDAVLFKDLDLFVKSKDVDRLLNKPPVVAEDKSYYSSNLKILIEAAEKFWKDADLNDKNTYPENQQVVIDWLVSKGLSKASAEQGAVIIRPSNAAVGRPKSN